MSTDILFEESPWIEQPVDGGTPTAPLRVRGFTRSIGFAKTGDRLVGTSKELCGFVAHASRGAMPGNSAI
ncbi:hypothetical protein [Nonomuraea basaltis]|uniref:hypothetical protein n=1 Tax=Nonomuraea basaltis TaxID=2495887 RepID=UPI00110C6D79|nr:hypothetical protein [Nonomuraea basaltis]TMR99726.1 hypothetical protein EJK15_05500 [Nonomuraea basaltis]